MSKYSNKKPFTATLKWLEVVQRFYAEMPLDSHRHNLRYFSETFMASKAVDFLCNLLPSVFEKECSKESALKVLGLFLRDGLIENVIRQDYSRVYDNSALYRFCDGKIKQYIENKGGKVTRRVKRTSSLQSENERIKLNSRNREMDNNGFAIDFKADLMKRDPPYLPYSGRVSMSCSNLSVIVPAKSSASFFVQSAQVARKGVRNICDTVLRSTETIKKNSLIPLRGSIDKEKRVKILSQHQDTQVLSRKSVSTANGEIISSRINERICRQQTNMSRTPTYRDQIDKNTYELQLHEMDKKLLKLLNNTIADKNMCAETKAAFIKDFRTKYPRIYEMRFPDNKKLPELIKCVQGSLITEFQQLKM